ncbi:MAG: DUF3332 domain-containing protein [Bacteroidaceae bacterium]|nr:DUF3332 domain-containing protein [Bacteroidaceae bacterium]
MKKFKVSALCALLCGSIMLSSCIGSFGLFNKVRTWNEGVTDSKFVNELLFLAMWIVPVYEISMLADGLVLNTIEFWSGSNPVAKAGEVKKVQGEKGEYLVKTNADGYTITNEAGEELNLKFDEEAQSWNVMNGDEAIELLTINGDGTVNMNLQNGTYMQVTLDAAGMTAARQAIDRTCGFAQR